MSAEEDLKRFEKLVDVLTLKVVKALAKETARGAYYAFIGEVLKEKLPGILKSGKSEEEIQREILEIIKQAQETQAEKAIPQTIQVDEIRRIIREELSKAVPEIKKTTAPQQPAPATAQPVQPATVTYPQPQPQQYPQPVYRQPTPIRRNVEWEIEEINKDISHYKELLRILETRRARGEISEDEYIKQKQEYEEKIRDLRLKKERLIITV